ncbi:MAG TPA: LuxR C-terminal-related transcriptional regulator [Virgibacillus sp.]|nr:LuxR C-terminal-related transcriptional regulator [Virgibacillus sp.]
MIIAIFIMKPIFFLIIRENSERSKELFISVKTVANHMTAILRKLNVSNRVKAAFFAVKYRWFIL